MMPRAKLIDVEHAKAISGVRRGSPTTLPRFSGPGRAGPNSCIFEAMLYRGKPARMVVASSCLLRRTAEQALFLDASVSRRR